MNRDRKQNTMRRVYTSIRRNFINYLCSIRRFKNVRTKLKKNCKICI
nr:MAG TPA: hypothetical protein [Myoviridae sp. ctNPX13]